VTTAPAQQLHCRVALGVHSFSGGICSWGVCWLWLLSWRPLGPAGCAWAVSGIIICALALGKKRTRSRDYLGIRRFDFSIAGFGIVGRAAGTHSRVYLIWILLRQGHHGQVSWRRCCRSDGGTVLQYLGSPRDGEAGDSWRACYGRTRHARRPLGKQALSRASRPVATLLRPPRDLAPGV